MSQWSTQIDQITEAFFQNFGSLDAEQLSQKPADDGWSVAQHIEHLMILNASYFPEIEKLKQGNYPLPWTAKMGFLPSLFGKMLLKAVQPDYKKKMKTFPVWEPEKNVEGTNILKRFESHQEELKQMIKSSDALIKQGAIVVSPANKHIVYKLETAFDILVAHEQRHLEQAKTVAGSVNT